MRGGFIEPVLPNGFGIMREDSVVRCQEGGISRFSGGDDDPIRRIAVRPFHFCHTDPECGINGKKGQAVQGFKTAGVFGQGSWKLDFSQALFPTDFPKTHGADKKELGGGFVDDLTGSGAQLFRVQGPPQKRAGIQNGHDNSHSDSVLSRRAAFGREAFPRQSAKISSTRWGA